MEELMLRINQNPGSIELNFDELELQLDKRLDEYKGALFTEASKDIAKKETASLRRLKKEIDDARKTIKKEWMRPYDEFETRMKRLMEKVDEPIQLIDGQVKEFEAKRKAEKREKIEALYKEMVGEVPDYEEYIELSKIYDSKWENTTASFKSIKEDLTDCVSRTIMAVDTIKAMHSDKEEEALKLYKRTADMSGAISLINTYEANKAEALKREEERRRAEEERRIQLEVERARAAERASVAREERARQEEREKVIRESRVKPVESVPEIDGEALPFEQPTTVTAYYKVVATPEELEQVEMAFNSIGIYFERRNV